MEPIPARLHTLPNITTYTDALDWRARNPVGNIPLDPSTPSRFWVDRSAVDRLSRIESLKRVFPNLSFPTNETAYRIIPRDNNGKMLRVSIGSPAFHSSYAPTMAFNSAVQTMIQYKFVYEDLLGQPPALTTLTVPDPMSSTPNFSGEDPRYPLDLKSDHVYFPIGEELYALPIRDFIQRFSPKSTDYASMRRAVLDIATSTAFSDESAISLIRLAVQEPPKTPPLI